MGEHHQTKSQYAIPVKHQSPLRGSWEEGIPIPATPTRYLEYSGAGLGIAGWLGVRQIGSIGAQELGFLVWIISGLILIAWGYHMRARGIMLINAVNVVMAASAFVAMV
jgi:hypothetical protein